MTPGQKVRVHFNLHKRDWSVVAMDGPMKGKVIERADGLTLTDCTFKVSEASRLKVLEHKVRSVHAWIHGRIAQTTSPDPEATEFNYNPYRASTFTVRGTWAPIHAARTVWFTEKRAYAKP
jgi:hypothetical protein